MFDVPCCLCCREEEADWLDFVAYTRRKNVTNPWSFVVFSLRDKETIESSNSK